MILRPSTGPTLAGRTHAAGASTGWAASRSDMREARGSRRPLRLEGKLNLLALFRAQRIQECRRGAHDSEGAGCGVFAPGCYGCPVSAPRTSCRNCHSEK